MSKLFLIRSPLFYVGDKFKLIPQLSDHFPNNIERFIEPFTGGGSVFLNVNANTYFLNDLNDYVISLHKFLSISAKEPEEFFKNLKAIIFQYGLSRSFIQDIVPDDLKTKHKKTYYAQFNKSAYSKLRYDFNNDKSNYLFLYLLLIYGFNRMLRFNSKGDFNLPVGNVDLNNNVVNALYSYFDSIIDLDIHWSAVDYKEFLNSFSYNKNDFVYLDPPYLISSSEYNKFWTENDEIELYSEVDRLNQNGVKFALSNVTHYRERTNEILISWSSKYNSIPIKSNYISFNDNSIKSFKEVLITNY
jgi:DNA adenine methylase